MKDKGQVGADIYIEDAPDNIEKLRKAGLYTICFANSTNKKVEQPRAESWEEAYELIKDYSSKLKE